MGFSSNDYGEWLVPTTTAVGTNVYAYLASPGTDFVAAVWDSQTGDKTVEITRNVATPLVTCPAAVGVYDFNLLILGAQEIPVHGIPALTYEEYRDLGMTVVGVMRINQTGAGNTLDLRQWVHAFRYYIFVLTDTTTAPGANIEFELLFGG